MSQLEHAARKKWWNGAVQRYHGRCDVCGRTRDEQDRLLKVARQRRRRERECLECWDERQR